MQLSVAFELRRFREGLAQYPSTDCAPWSVEGFLLQIGAGVDLMFKYNRAEVQSGLTRIGMAENLISQLPSDHDGRNTWLLNFGKGHEAQALREKRGVAYVRETESAATVRSVWS